MYEVECPYCNKEVEIEADYINFDQESINEIDCPKCECTFVATTYIDVNLCQPRKAPCLNGDPHNYRKVSRYPLVIGGNVNVRCIWCSKEKEVSYKEASLYGYDQNVVDKEEENDPFKRSLG